MPEISIIVPVYKVEAYLPDCVRSLQAQTFRDIEIILVNDGSPDRCPQICDDFAARDSRIRVIHQKNAGLSSARNAGIDAAVGRYLCFVDSDDLVSADFCHTLHQLLDQKDCDFSVCGVCRFQDGREPEPKETGEICFITNSEYTKMQLERRTEFGVWNKLFRRELFDHIRFMPGRLHEDVIFSADLLRTLRGGAVCTSRQLYYYRQREGGIVSATAVKCSPDRVFAGEYLLSAVKETCPELILQAMHYAVYYPWMFVDPIYVRRSFRENRAFLDILQDYLLRYLSAYEENFVFSDILIRRMTLFAKSRFLYGFNAYTRLLRVYLFHMLGKDAYANGHGI